MGHGHQPSAPTPEAQETGEAEHQLDFPSLHASQMSTSRIEHGHQPSVGRPLFPTSEVQVQPDSSPSTRKNCDQETGEAEHELDLPRMQVTQMSKARKNQVDQDFEQHDFNLSLCASHLAVHHLFKKADFDQEEVSQKYPLKKRVAEIISTRGIESMDEDVEHILSMALKIIMQEWIESALKLSKRRIDLVKARQQERKQTEVAKRCTFNDNHNGKLGTTSGTSGKTVEASKDLEEKGNEDQLLGKSCLTPQMEIVSSLTVNDVLEALKDDPRHSRSYLSYLRQIHKKN